MYSWLTYAEIKKFIPEMEKLGVSKVARGEDTSSVTDKGFLEVYKQLKSSKKMYNEFATKNTSWGERRDNFVARHLTSYNSNPTKRRRLALIAWAYDPEKETKYGIRLNTLSTGDSDIGSDSKFDLSRYEKLESTLKNVYFDV